LGPSTLCAAAFYPKDCPLYFPQLVPFPKVFSVRGFAPQFGSANLAMTEFCRPDFIVPSLSPFFFLISGLPTSAGLCPGSASLVKPLFLLFGPRASCVRIFPLISGRSANRPRVSIPVFRSFIGYQTVYGFRGIPCARTKGFLFAPGAALNHPGAASHRVGRIIASPHLLMDRNQPLLSIKCSEIRL